MASSCSCHVCSKFSTMFACTRLMGKRMRKAGAVQALRILRDAAMLGHGPTSNRGMVQGCGTACTGGGCSRGLSWHSPLASMAHSIVCMPLVPRPGRLLKRCMASAPSSTARKPRICFTLSCAWRPSHQGLLLGRAVLAGAARTSAGRSTHQAPGSSRNRVLHGLQHLQQTPRLTLRTT